MQTFHPLPILLLAIAFSSLSHAEPSPTIFGIRIVDAPARPSYGAPKPSYGAGGLAGLAGPPNILEGVSSLKAGALRGGASALRFKGDVFYGGANALDQTANALSPSSSQPLRSNQLRRPPFQQFPQSQQLNFGGITDSFTGLLGQNGRPSYKPPQTQGQSQRPSYNPQQGGFNNNNPDGDVITINNQPDVVVNGRAPNNVDQGLQQQLQQLQLQQFMLQQQQQQQRQQRQQQQQQQTVVRAPMQTGMRVKDMKRGPKIQQCEERFTQLVGDIFIGNELVPDIIDTPPQYPLELTYRTVRTFPGMRVTAEATRFKPMVEWPAEEGALYTLVLSNLDINTRENRTLSEFWHWFVANIPGDSVDDGEVIFDLLFPLVLPEGDGNHRFGYFVMKQPHALDYRLEGGPTDSCSPNMSKGRGPRRSIKDLIRKYDLELTASTFLIMDADQASLEIACQWQRCMGGQVTCPSEL